MIVRSVSISRWRRSITLSILLIFLFTLFSFTAVDSGAEIESWGTDTWLMTSDLLANCMSIE